MEELKKVFTTGEVSKLLGIAQKTVKNYCDRGKLVCEQTPLTNYRRIPREALVHFMEQNSIPLNLLISRQPLRILVVEDDEIFSDFMGQLLTDTFPEALIETAVDGYEACMKAIQFVPDFVILDLIIPKEEGIKVCRRIKENTMTKHTEIIVVSANIDDDKIEELKKLNTVYAFGKPLDTKAFLQAMQESINKRIPV